MDIKRYIAIVLSIILSLSVSMPTNAIDTALGDLEMVEETKESAVGAEPLAVGERFTVE